MDLLIASMITTGLVIGLHYFPLRRILRRDIPEALQFLMLACIWGTVLTVLFRMWQQQIPDWALGFNLTIMDLLILAMWSIGIWTVIVYGCLDYLDVSLDNRDGRVIAEGEGEILRENLKK